MGKINLTTNSIDVGIVTHNEPTMLDFYINTLGLTKEIEIPFPGLGTVNKLNYAYGYIKILVLNEEPKHKNHIGDFTTAPGIRYITINLSNLSDLVDKCKSKNIKIINEPIEIRPGVKVAVIQDPDGNLIELMQAS